MIKLLKYLKKYWFYALLAPIFMLLEVLMDLVITNEMGKMIDTVNSYTPLLDQSAFISTIVKYGLMMLLFVVIGVACGILSGVFANLASQKFGNDLRKDLFNKIMNLTFEQTDNFSTSSLITRVTNDVTMVQNTIAQAIRMFIRALSFFVLGIVFTIRISAKFAIILAIVLPIEVLMIIWFMRKVFPIFTIIQKKLDKVNSVVHENLTGARVVKAFSKEDYEYDRFEVANNDLTNINLKVNKIMAVLMPMFMLIVYAATIAIYYLGLNSQVVAINESIFKSPSITVGDTQKAVTYISMIMSSLIMLGMTFANMARAVASARRINDVLDSKDIIKSGNFDTKELTTKGKLEFKNVSFTYPLGKSSVLSNLNFEISKGETIAIVGSTGSGKSTLVNLIPRFYDVTSGSILVDGINIKDYNLKELRDKVVIVLQKAELFSGTIADNIRWGKEDASDEEIEKAAQIAQAEEFILSKEKGYDEYVEEKGTSLSGGQKQRLSIARAIVKKPEILIFDDSTSALDLVTEAKLYKAMKENISEVTKIVVAQRVATAKNADRIIVLDNGNIAAFDTHENLLNNCSIYQDIYNSQLKREGENNA